MDVQSGIYNRTGNPSEVPKVRRNAKKFYQCGPNSGECIDRKLDLSLTIRAVKRQCHGGAPKADRSGSGWVNPSPGTRKVGVEQANLPQPLEIGELKSKVRMMVGVVSRFMCRVEKRPPKLDLDVYPSLPKANVGKTCAASYLCLMSGCVR